MRKTISISTETQARVCVKHRDIDTGGNCCLFHWHLNWWYWEGAGGWTHWKGTFAVFDDKAIDHMIGLLRTLILVQDRDAFRGTGLHHQSRLLLCVVVCVRGVWTCVWVCVHVCVCVCVRVCVCVCRLRRVRVELWRSLRFTHVHGYISMCECMHQYVQKGWGWGVQTSNIGIWSKARISRHKTAVEGNVKCGTMWLGGDTLVIEEATSPRVSHDVSCRHFVLDFQSIPHHHTDDVILHTHTHKQHVHCVTLGS